LLNSLSRRVLRALYMVCGKWVIWRFLDNDWYRYLGISKGFRDAGYCHFGKIIKVWHQSNFHQNRWISPLCPNRGYSQYITTFRTPDNY
jgi:hypothetical protein